MRQTTSSLTFRLSSNGRRKFACLSSRISTLSKPLRDPSLLLSSSFASVSPSNRTTFNVCDPASSVQQYANGEAILAVLQSMDRHDASDMIDRSSVALPSWRDSTTNLKRSKILQRLSYLMHENIDDLSTIMTLESGKPLRESRGEVAYAASFLDYYAGEAIRSNCSGGGAIIPTPFEHSDGTPKGSIITVNEAVGVTALITPWNFPLAMLTRKIGPALAAGCTVVVKPSDETPLSALAFETLAHRAGIPQDVLQVLIVSKDHTQSVGLELCTNEKVRKISFTGSTAVGKLLMKNSSNQLKRLSLELGGNAPFIVFEDCNIDQAVAAAISSKFRNAGQTCVCADRFIIHEKVEEAFLSKLSERVSKFRVGPGMDEETTMGPLISHHAVERVRKKVQDAVSCADNYTELLLGGSTLPHIGPNFFEPTIIRNVSTSIPLWKAETFGPIVATTTFQTEDEAVALANGSKEGLASYFCTNNSSRIARVASRLQTGIVGVNEGIISTAHAPFGGVKESGFGREGSAEGMKEFLETKYIFMNLWD